MLLVLLVRLALLVLPDHAVLQAQRVLQVQPVRKDRLDQRVSRARQGRKVSQDLKDRRVKEEQTASASRFLALSTR